MTPVRSNHALVTMSKDAFFFFSHSILRHVFLSQPMGVYGTSTWYQGVSPTPPAHPAASSSNCRTIPTVTATPAQRKRDGLARSYIGSFPTPAPEEL